MAAGTAIVLSGANHWGVVTMGKRGFRALCALLVSLVFAVAGVGPGVAQAPPPPGDGDTPTLSPGAQIPEPDDETEARLLLLDQQFISTRTAGDVPLSVEQAGALRRAAADQAKALKNASAAGPTTFSGNWGPLGPNPIVQIGRSDNAFIAVSGRIGALAIRRNGQFILGAAQGGIWLYNPADGTWTPKTDTLASTAIGALAVAPKDDNVVYAGTGEGALSGDSYYGNGILKSTDGGSTWAHVSGDFFAGVSTARLAVDPNDSNRLYAAIERGRGGARRVSPPIHSTYGIWESHDGAVTWTLRMAAPAVSLGATDIRLDPQNPTTLYASFWGDKIYKSTNGGATWSPIMNGLPTDANFAAGLTRFNLALSHPAGHGAVLYTGSTGSTPPSTTRTDASSSRPIKARPGSKPATAAGSTACSASAAPSAATRTSSRPIRRTRTAGLREAPSDVKLPPRPAVWLGS